MNIAYLTTYDSGDIKQWSGLGYYMRKCLADQGVKVIPVNCSVPFSKWLLLKAKLIKLVFGKSYQLERDHQYLKSIAIKAKSALELIEHDVVFSPGSLPIVYLESKKPIVFWTDATFDCLYGFYNSANLLSASSHANGNRAEQLSINKAALIFYSSDWGRKSAIEKYKADPRRVLKLPFGSNLDHDTSLQNIRSLIVSRMDKKELKFLFVGVDWQRKGGDIAFQVVTKLRECGMDARLIVVGCTPGAEIIMNPFVEVHSFISKHTHEGQQLLNKLYEDASYFILPTKAECTPVVFSEAASYGLPVLTSNVGGLTSVINHNYTGYCFDLSTFVEDTIKKVALLKVDKVMYEEISKNAFFHFRKHLDWNVIGRLAVNAMKELTHPNGNLSI